jgi:SSS family solute:Na+ symporter
MFITAALSLAMILAISYYESKVASEKGIDLSKELFKTSPAFNIGATIVTLICAILYALFW